ncbi:MAG: S-layer homology domain-containing protein [Clostridia bacterium]|nr:S-layer homology domain-containing protein [Clostridia bacterium]
MKRKELSLIAGIALCTLTVLLTVVYVMRPAPTDGVVYVAPCDTDADTAEAIRAVTESGYMSLSLVDGSAYFYPDQPVRRGELAVILCAMLSPETGADKDAALGIADEHDVPASQLSAVRTAVAHGYMRLHGDYTFRPSAMLTREEVADVFGALCAVEVSTGRTEEITDLDEISPHFRKNAERLIELGILQGSDGRLRPKDIITREELALIIHRITESEYFIQRKP